MTAAPPPEPQPHRDAKAWPELIAALDEAAMIALIGSWMGPQLRAQVTPDDLWQETLFMAWRDGDAHEWRGMPAFRAWLRGIARNRVHDAIDRLGAQKRGGDRVAVGFSNESQGSGDGILPPLTTTPSREVGRQERSQALQAALDSLPDDCRDLVRLCLFEELSVPAAAKQLALPTPPPTAACCAAPSCSAPGCVRPSAARRTQRRAHEPRRGPRTGRHTGGPAG